MIEDTGWVSACMSYCIAHMAHLSKLTSRFLISIGPFAEIRGGSSAMQAVDHVEDFPRTVQGKFGVDLVKRSSLLESP